MSTTVNADPFASGWIHAWNQHDLDEILAHYSDEVVLVSPAAAKLLQRDSGVVKGKKELRAYFKMGLEAYPNLTFELIDIMEGTRSVVLYYRNQTGGRTAEFMEFNGAGKVIRVIAHYSRQ